MRIEEELDTTEREMNPTRQSGRRWSPRSHARAVAGQEGHCREQVGHRSRDISRSMGSVRAEVESSGRCRSSKGVNRSFKWVQHPATISGISSTAQGDRAGQQISDLEWKVAGGRSPRQVWCRTERLRKQRRRRLQRHRSATSPSPSPRPAVILTTNADTELERNDHDWQHASR